MKRVINPTFLFMTLFFSSIAQETKEVNYGENPDECKNNLTIMQTYYNQKAYEDAARSYRKCLNRCPESSKNIYIVGERVMKHYIKKNKENQRNKCFFTFA